MQNSRHKKLKIIFIGIALCYNSCNNKIKVPHNDTDRIINLKIDLANFQDHLQQKKYHAITDLTMQKYVELNGGTEKYTENLKNLFTVSNRNNFIIKETGIVIKGKESFYSIVNEKTGQSVNSIIIAQSNDNGVTWKFLEVDRLKKHEIIKLFPATDIRKLKTYLKLDLQ